MTHSLKICMSRHDMGWLRLAGSLKLYVSFAEYSLFYRALLQKRPVISRSLVIIVTPYHKGIHHLCDVCLYMKWLIHFCNAIGSIHMWHDIFVHLTWAIHQWHDPLLNTNPPHWFPGPCTCTRIARITMIWHIGNTAMCCWSKPDTSQIWGLQIKLTSSYQNTFQVVNIYLPNVIPTNALVYHGCMGWAQFYFEDVGHRPTLYLLLNSYNSMQSENSAWL